LTLDRHGFASGGSPSETAPSGKHERRSSDARRDRRPRDLLADDSAESHPRRTRRSPDPRSSEPATEQRRHRPISDSAESILPAGRSQGAPASESFADHRRHLPASDSAESHPPADSARDASASEAFADHRQHLPTNDFAESHPPADSARDAPASESFADHRRHLPTNDSAESDSPGDRRLADFRTFDSAEPGRSRDRHSRHDNEAKADGARGHGQLTLSVGAGGALRPIELLAAGPVLSRRATAILARLPTHVAEREHAIVQQRLGFAATDCEVREVPDGGPANVLLLEIERACGRELVSAFGEKGLRAELVARRACDQLASFLAAGVPVGEHLADQLLLPLALAGGGRFRAAPLSLHATTNIETIQRFLDVQISVEPDGDAVTVNVG
jgi:hypothetical protein